MTSFDYAGTGLAIRPDLPEAYRDLWSWIARPGAWWSGAERVAIAAEVRAARLCTLCEKRRDAVSPNAVTGAHDRAPDSPLPEAAVDAVHRIVTDATRLSSAFVSQLQTEGVSDAHYVELLGITVLVTSVDAFHRALGLEPEPLPAPAPGEPSRVRPPAAVRDVGWVAMIPAAAAVGDEADLYPATGHAPNVIRALSLVPDCVRRLRDLSAAMYLPVDVLTDVGAETRRAIDRSQIELVAGRVSAINECFY